ncbi:MAG: hypothetical protein IJC56_12035 [Clostridia bacterium]|nr:hypothetical protein [Clostridia bacterium]
MDMSWKDRFVTAIGVALIGGLALVVGNGGLAWAKNGDSLISMLAIILFWVIRILGLVTWSLSPFFGLALMADGIISGIGAPTMIKIYMWGCVVALVVGLVGIWTQNELGLEFKSFGDAFRAFGRYLHKLKIGEALRCFFALFPERSFMLSAAFLGLAVFGILIDVIWGGSAVYDVISCIVAVACTIVCASALIGGILMVLCGIGMLLILGVFGEVDTEEKGAHEHARNGTVRYGSSYVEAKYIVNNPLEFRGHDVVDAEERLKDFGDN